MDVQQLFGKAILFSGQSTRSAVRNPCSWPRSKARANIPGFFVEGQQVMATRDLYLEGRDELAAGAWGGWLFAPNA